MADRLKNIHPGEVLKEEFLIPFKITQDKLAKDIGVQPIAISQIVNRKRSITPETALLLGKYFNVPSSFWLGLQADYDTEEARATLGEKLKRIVPIATETPLHV